MRRSSIKESCLTENRFDSRRNREAHLSMRNTDGNFIRHHPEVAKARA
jgi:hypothetical protein